MTPEARLQQAVCAALRGIGCRVHENIVVRKGRRATGAGKGSPDLLVAVPGVRPRWAEHVWLELKTDEGVVSQAQRDWHAEAALAGERVHVVRSVLEAVEVVTRLRQGGAR